MSRHNPNRRRFLQSLGALGLYGTLPLSGRALAQTAGDRVLILIHQDGGCDGLNTVIPYADQAYAAARPNLAIAATDILALDGSLGLHPSLTGLKAWYDLGKVAVINGVGYPGFSQSHFTAEDIYWTASPEDPTGPTGWLGRGLDVLSPVDTLSATAIENRAPKSLAATSYTAPAIPDPERYVFQVPAAAGEGAAQLAAAEAIFGQAGIGEPLFDGVLAADVAALDSVESVASAVAAYETSVAYPDDALAQDLKFAGQLIHADLGVRVITLSQGGYDTHASQSNTLASLLSSLSGGIDAFMQDAVAGGFADRVAILVWTEFGRRVAENASLGTDHGSSAPMFLIGSGVSGGLHGTYPSLSDLESGNLKMTTDFRTIYASVLESWLGWPADSLLGGNWGRLPLFA